MGGTAERSASKVPRGLPCARTVGHVDPGYGCLCGKQEPTAARLPGTYLFLQRGGERPTVGKKGDGEKGDDGGWSNRGRRGSTARQPWTDQPFHCQFPPVVSRSVATAGPVFTCRGRRLQQRAVRYHAGGPQMDGWRISCAGGEGKKARLRTPYGGSDGCGRWESR